jgi:hypothetical protein
MAHIGPAFALLVALVSLPAAMAAPTVPGTACNGYDGTYLLPVAVVPAQGGVYLFITSNPAGGGLGGFQGHFSPLVCPIKPQSPPI